LKLSNLELKNPTMNASGVCSSYPSLLKRWERAGVGALVTKPIRMEESPGYKNPTFIEPYPGAILNAMGIPGGDYKYSLNEIKQYEFEVPVIFQIHGKNEKEFGFLIKEAHPYGDAFELNVSCPHIDKGGYHIGFEPKILKKVLKKARKSTDKPISVKLPYYSADERKLKDVIEIIEETEMDWITEINTLRAMDYSPELGRPILSNKIGGQSGPTIHFCAQAQVFKTREFTDLPIVATGGIVNAYDVKRFFGVGANAVQLGSGLLYHENIEDFVKKILDGIQCQ
jgi:dihydroorotate dehydrogenase (NAD+) catalytic subunit